MALPLIRPPGSILAIFIIVGAITLIQFVLTEKSADSELRGRGVNDSPLSQKAPKLQYWEAPQPMCNGKPDGSIAAYHLESIASERNTLKHDPVCLANSCSSNSLCFLGTCFCKPGYEGEDCAVKKVPANPWYIDFCPNLHLTNTLNVTTPLELLGGEYSRKDTVIGEQRPGAFAYLCFSHPNYGTAVVPFSLWHAAQEAEGALWVKESVGKSSNQNDRAVEHWDSYDSFSAVAKHLESGAQLGRVIEVGAGPWTQFKGILHRRPDFVSSVSEYTVWEPNARRYMENVSSCSYREGDKLYKWDGNGTYTFPVVVQSDGGELLTSTYDGSKVPISLGISENKNENENETEKEGEKEGEKGSEKNELFDTLISINVIEHTQDAFKYLTGLYLSLRKGGLLIFHDRYYNDDAILNGDLYHPIRIKKIILDRFSMGFKTLYNNCSAGYGGRKGEEGYYIVAVKL